MSDEKVLLFLKASDILTLEPVDVSPEVADTYFSITVEYIDGEAESPLSAAPRVCEAADFSGVEMSAYYEENLMPNSLLCIDSVEANLLKSISIKRCNGSGCSNDRNFNAFTQNLIFDLMAVQQ